MSELYDEQGDPGGEAVDPYGLRWDEAGYEPDLASMDPAEYQEAIRQLVTEQVAVERGERERMAQGEAEAQEIVASAAAELGFEQASFEQIEESASSDVYAVATGLLAQAGYRPDQADALLRESGDGGFALVAEVYGISPRELAERALAGAVQRAFAAAPSKGDESAVLAKYQRLAAGPQQGGRPSQAGAYPAWAADLVNRV